MDWTVRPHHGTNLQTRNFQIQGMYQSQQPASGFSQASAPTANSSVYPGNYQPVQVHSHAENMVANQVPSPNNAGCNNFQSSANNVGSNSFQPPLVTSASVRSFVPVQNFVGPHQSIQCSNTTGMATNAWPNSNGHSFTPAAPQLSTGSTVQRPPNLYTALNRYNNCLQKNYSHSEQAAIFKDNTKNSRRLPMLLPKYQPADPRTCATVPPNQVSSHLLNSQHNFSSLTFPAGQNIQNQINDMSPGSTAAMQSQQYASNSVYLSYSTPTDFAAQVIPQATYTSLPLQPAYTVPPAQVNHGEFVLPQPVTNTSNENIHNTSNLQLDQRSGSYSVQYVHTLEHVPASTETIAGAEKQPPDESTKSAVIELKSVCESLQIPGRIPRDTTSTSQTTSNKAEDTNNASKNSGNFLPRLAKSKPITKESLELDYKKLLAIKKKLFTLAVDFKLKSNLYLSTSAQTSKDSDPPVRNPDISPASSNASQQLASFPQTTHETFSPPSYDTAQKHASVLPHDSTQNQPPSLLACNSNEIQDGSPLPLNSNNHLHPILLHLLKGTVDEEMLLNFHVASTERNQSKQLLVLSEKCSSGPVLDSNGARSEAGVNDIERVSQVSLKTSQAVSMQGSLTSTSVSLGLEQTSALGKDQLTNTLSVSGRDLFNSFTLNRDKTRMFTTETQTCPQSTVSVQSPTAPSEPLQMSGKIAMGESKDSLDFQTVLFQQTENHCLRTPDKRITALNNGSDACSSSTLASTVSGAGIVQKSSVTGNSYALGRACSLEELETSLALWRKSGSASLNDGVENKLVCTMKNFPGAVTEYEKSNVAAGKNDPALSFVSSTLGQKLDAINSSLQKSSEPQVAIVSPLRLSKEGIHSEAQGKNLSSVLEAVYPVIAEGSVHSLCKLPSIVSHTDKPMKRTVCSPSESCVAVKEINLDMNQDTVKSTEENKTQRNETRTECSFDTNQDLTGSLKLEKTTPPLCSRESFPPETGNNSSSQVPKISQDLLEPEDAVLNKNMLQISSVCTLVQGDAFYNSQIASIFNTSSLKSKAENITTSDDQRPNSCNNEQQLSHWKRDCEINENTSVGDGLLPLGTLSKDNEEKLLNYPALKISQGSKVSNEVTIRDSEKENTTGLYNPNSGKEPEQNISCSDVYSTDLASGNQCVPGNRIIDEDSSHCIQEHIPSDENRTHSVSNADVSLTSPSDQLTELLREFPYGIDPKLLKKTGNEDSAAKLIETKDGQASQTCEQSSDANPALDQIIVTILNPQQMKELFPENSSQSSNKVENREGNRVLVTSGDTNKSHIQTICVESTNASTETVQTPASQSYCCLKGWIGLDYVVEPCTCMLDKEASVKPQLGQYLPPEIIIKEEPEANENSQQQNMCPVGNNLPSENGSSRILCKTFEHREEKHKPLKGDKPVPLPSLEQLEALKPKEQGIEELTEKVQISRSHNQKCAILVSKSQGLLCSGRVDSKGESITARKRESSDKERTSRETVVDRSKSSSVWQRSMGGKNSNKIEKYKIKRDSNETHIIKGPTHTFQRGLKKHTASEGKQKTSKRPHSTVTNSSSLKSAGLASKTYSNAQHSQEHANGQKCEIERDLETNRAVRTEHNEPSSSEPTQQNKGSSVKTRLKKFAYPEERGNVWQYRRSLLDNSKTSKLQTFRGQNLNMYKTHPSVKEAGRAVHKRDKGFQKSLFDRIPSYNRKSNTLTLRREEKKNYLNKVAFRQTERSICLTKIEQSPSKSIWHVKPNNTSEHREDKKNSTPCSQQSEETEPQMLEFKMCPEIVFRNLVSEEVPEAKTLPEKETTPVVAVKSTREDWMNYLPPKKRKMDGNETQVSDLTPVDIVMELLDKDEALKKSKATFETYKKMHLEKRSQNLDNSPLN